MAKTVRKTSLSKAKSTNYKATETKNNYNLGGVVVFIINKFGSPGLLILLFLLILVIIPSKAQQAQFFDKYFLFENYNNCNIKFLTVTLIASVSFLFQWRYYKLKISFNEKEINRISVEKTEFQLKALGKLNTSS
jgi:hypothetical protein